jgi:hypothetical protein
VSVTTLAGRPGTSSSPRLAHRSFRLTRPSRAALICELRPPIVLEEPAARLLLAIAGGEDVCAGGTYSAGADGIEIWSAPWDGRGSRPGTSELLSTVSWAWRPDHGTLTLLTVGITVAGLGAGQSVSDVLFQVLDLPGKPRPPFIPQQRSHTRAVVTTRW